jgi:glutamate-1-semialdehyde 2,1-aminomutase
MNKPALRRHDRSEMLHARACLHMPGGVNSPVRAFGAVGGTPPFIVSGRGNAIIDADGNTYCDYVGSWGPLILGHAHPRVVEAVVKAAGSGLSFGACHAAEIELAEAIRARMPHLELLRLVNSGTEAAMSAIRLARAATGRDKIVKFAGCYHGHADSFLVQAGSGALTFGTPSSPGVPLAVAADTLLARYNDLDSVSACFAGNTDSIACVIVEPVAGNMGVMPPRPGFLAGLRQLCDRHGALLVFDEVITGFRVHPGGAAALYGIAPDLTVLGKIIGGGLPVGAFGGRAELMRELAPLGPVYQAGTLSGNPLACAAGIATLRVLEEENPYERIDRLAVRLESGLRNAIRAAGQAGTVNRVGSMLTLFFGPEEVRSLIDAVRADTARFARWHGAMLKAGHYLPPAQFEAMFVSAAHTESDIDATIEAAGHVLNALSGDAT